MHNNYRPEPYRKRRILIAVLALIIITFVIVINTPNITNQIEVRKPTIAINESDLAISALSKLVIKGRAPKTGYSRKQFGDDWQKISGCDTRDIILNRDMANVKVNIKCQVVSGILNDPYTGKIINFTRGDATSSAVQINHVVASSDAWQKGT